MKLTPLPQAPKPAMVHEHKDYFTLPQLIDYANAVAETKLTVIRTELKEMTQRWKLAERLRDRPRVQVPIEECGSPHYREEK